MGEYFAPRGRIEVGRHVSLRQFLFETSRRGDSELLQYSVFYLGVGGKTVYLEFVKLLGPRHPPTHVCSFRSSAHRQIVP